jgi:two-component system, NarL family, response regulator DevR
MTQSEARRIRILVVDDHEVLREGLAAMLQRQPGYEVVAQAGSVAEALTASDRFRPDLVILDISLPDGSGIEVCRKIKASHPECLVVILTGSSDEDTVLAAVIAGANGYLLKQSGIREVVHAIEVVASGGSLLDPLATERVLREIRRASDRSESNPFSNLTTRERRIMDLIAAGMTNMEIAADISVSEKTVKRSVSAILLKLNLERRGQAAALYTGRRSPD